MSWVLLLIAIALEIAGTTCMKLSDGFTKTTPSILMLAFYGLALGLLAVSFKRIDVSVAYAIWSGLGTAIIAIIGMVYFKEPAGAMKLISLMTIIAGVVGLQLSGGGH